MPFQPFVERNFDTFIAMLPVSYAFAVGMLAAVNPCGFALLPGYLGLYLRGQEEAQRRRNLWLRAVLVSAMMTLGFVLLFGLAGLVVSAGGRFVFHWSQWLGLIMGVGLIVWGALMLTGRQFYSGLAQRASARIPGTAGGGPSAFFFFGLAYGLASLGCALPLFGIVVTSALSSGRVGDGMLQFLSYALGMGLVMLVITLFVAGFKGALLRQIRRSAPVIERASAVLVVLAGIGITYYWLTIGGLGSQIRGWF